MATTNLTLSPELEEFISARVASGRYDTAMEVIAEGLRLLEAEERSRETTLAEFRELLAVGVRDAECGNVYDGATFMNELIRKHEARAARGG